MAAAPSCGEINNGAGDKQTSESLPISNSHPSDHMSDLLPSVMWSDDSVRYFRHDTLTNTDDYLTVYDHNS